MGSVRRRPAVDRVTLDGAPAAVAQGEPMRTKMEAALLSFFGVGMSAMSRSQAPKKLTHEPMPKVIQQLGEFFRGRSDPVLIEVSRDL